MAIDLYSETSGTITMSPRISFSFSQSDTVPVEQLFRSLSSSSSPEFNFCLQQNPDHHPASMADELFSNGKIIPTQMKQQVPPPPPPPQPPVQTNSSKSFWGFKRSSSCGNGYAPSLCPIPLMSRSNSTGSTTGTKRSVSSKDGCAYKHPPNSQKPPLRKTNYGYGNGNGNGVRVNPVLNLGFGSFFSSSKKK